MSIQRIINIAETYLSTIIDAGKTAHTFKTRVSTKLLVNKILSRFRIFMKDEQLVHEMILELKNLKNQNNEEGY
jgi:glycine cleavage system protein P-like pyridoxal-binding family